MTVHKDDSGRRSVQVEVELPGNQAELWRAVATPEGISSWFVPTTAEYDADGQPVRVVANFGPGMESVSTVTEWNPPHRLSAESRDLGESAPVVTTHWVVEPRGNDSSVVRVVHSLVASTDEWDGSLEAWAGGWPDFFRLLRLYVTHFPGQVGSSIQLSGTAPTPKSSAWSALNAALGLGDVQVGARCQSSGSAPTLSGVVERTGEGGHAEELVLRLDAPAPGIAHLFAMEMGGQVLLSIRFFLYGDSAAETRNREEPLWTAWFEGHVASSAEPDR